MSSRYLTNLWLALLGGWLIVASQAFAATTFTWLMFAAAIAAVVVALPPVALRSRGIPQRAIDAGLSVLAGWTIVASLVFAAPVAMWLGFASGAAILAIALVGLTVHEFSTERVVHSLELGGADEPAAHPLAGAH
ncbi:MAG TPA: hypothetical protein VHX88_12055 [Solirubrobacteraceae bacterium]|jgi:hypothetical protein|nr:hypothetical protein [Solirubrobacteraceae bacterium]